MATWNSRGLRGSTLEDMLNQSNMVYREKNLALVQKIPTPIKPVKIDQQTRQITLAFFEQISTVDYIGVVQGIPVCFDAKECATDTFPLQNLHKHQFAFMTDFEKQNGVSFLIIHFTTRDEFYYMPYWELKTYIERVERGAAKNFKYRELTPSFFMHPKDGLMIHYLEMLNKDLQIRDQIAHSQEDPSRNL